VLDRARRDNARVLLLESRSSGVIKSPYLSSIFLRRFLCQVAAGEKVVDDVGIVVVVTSLFCSRWCSIKVDDDEGVVFVSEEEEEEVISSKVLEDDLSSVVTCLDLENEQPIVLRILDGGGA